MRLLLALSVAMTLLLAPLAVAGPAPAVHYLADEASPFETGALETEAPSKNESSQRIVTAGIDGPSVWFSTPVQQGRLAGPAFLGLWTMANPAVLGDIEASLWLEADGNRTLLSSAALDAAIDPSQLPEPTSLVPPDPTDPEGAAYHVAAQLLPLLMSPPMVFDLGMIDAEAPANASLLLGLQMVGDPLPIGTSIIQYDAVTSPSFLFAPWYAPDPPAPQPTSSPPSSTSAPSSSGSSTSSPSPGGSSSSSSSSSSPEPDDEAPSEDSPGAGLLAALAALGAAAYVMRRR